MKKAERLNQELIFLGSKKYFNIIDLMKEFNISKRTALRDIQDLESMGLSLYVENGRYGGYQLLKQNLLTPIYFDSAEIISIFFALKALKLVSSTPFEKSYSQIYQKLLATLPKEQQQYVLKLLNSVDYHNTPPISNTPYLSLILESILDLKILDMTYNQYELVTKQVQIYDLFYRSGVWFCNAFDINSRTWAIYRCDCIEKCRVTPCEITFSHDQLKASLKEHEKNFRTIEFQCKLTTFGKELFLKNNYPGMELIEKSNNFYIVGFFNEAELHYMTHYLISFGKNIIVESPEFLKFAYLSELKKILQTYK